MSGDVFNLYSKYYDLLYRDKDYIGEANYINDLLIRNNISKGNILEFGSGTGKHGCLLAKLGHRVHGIELSPEMVAASEIYEGFTCQQGDICSINMERTYDSVISLFHVVSYQTSNQKILSVFSRASEHLRSGGLFIFDFWYSPAVLIQHPEVRVKHMADDVVEITRIAEPILYHDQNRVDVNYKIFARPIYENHYEAIHETHSMRHFSIPEIDLLAQMSSFKLEHVEEFLTGKKPGQDTWGVCVVLRKV